MLLFSFFISDNNVGRVIPVASEISLCVLLLSSINFFNVHKIIAFTPIIIMNDFFTKIHIFQKNTCTILKKEYNHICKLIVRKTLIMNDLFTK